MSVSEESIKNAEIYEGDLLAVDKQMEADHICILVAVIDDTCTIKRLACEHSILWLRPNNPG
jgi:DNA polymerase V